jgi:hypothetical protein
MMINIKTQVEKFKQPVLKFVVRMYPERATTRRGKFNPLTPELNTSAQRCLTRFFTEDFAS